MDERKGCIGQGKAGVLFSLTLVNRERADDRWLASGRQEGKRQKENDFVLITSPSPSTVFRSCFHVYVSTVTKERNK